MERRFMRVGLRVAKELQKIALTLKMVSSTTRSAGIVSATSGAAIGRWKMNMLAPLGSPDGLRFRSCCETQDGELGAAVLWEECPATGLETPDGRALCPYVRCASAAPQAQAG
jgi:hypothetical protein